MKHTFSIRGAILGSCLALAATATSAQELRGWNIHVEDYPVSIAMESFAAEVAERTNGEVTMKVFHNGVLGSQPDAIEQIRLGVLCPFDGMVVKYYELASSELYAVQLLFVFL